MKRVFFSVVVFGTLLYSCQNAEPNTQKIEEPKQTDEFANLHKQARTLFGALPEVAELPENNITDEKVQLGKVLYFDNRLSKDNTQSCNTCHNLSTFGVDNLPVSPGNNGGNGERNSPTTLNAALHFVQFWDGRENTVEDQAGGPITNPVEMAMPSEEAVVERLSGIKEYQEMFAAAFPEDADPISYNNLKMAIGAFERKLITPTRFDDYMHGDDNALTADEKRGLETFINTGCITCHTGNLLGGNMYQKFGLFSNYWEHTKSEKIDNGKFDVTQVESDKYFFKVPSLRNIEKTGPYFHDGSVADLSEAVRIMGKTQLNKDLTDEEVSSIVTFLNSLTGTVPPELATLE